MYLVATFVPGWKNRTFLLAFLLPDCQTSFGRRLVVPSEVDLVRVVKKLGGDAEELKFKLATWGQGSVHVHPTPAQMEWLAQEPRL